MIPRSLFALSFLLLGSCYDPVHEDEVAALGPEAPGVPQGPLHRAGQRCTTCHGEDGPGEPEWSVAGTLYRVAGKPEPLVGGTVNVTDAAGKSVALTSNAAGNFFVKKTEFDPVFPLKVNIQGEGVFRNMTTTIGRDGGCATCHRAGGSPQYTSAIYLREP